MPTFNADDLMNMETSEEMETKYTPIDEGEYLAEVKTIVARMVGADKDKPVFDIVWQLIDPPAAVVEKTGLTELTVRQSIFLDVDDAGRMATGKGKNVQLGRLRSALKQNGPSRWNPQMMTGQRATVRIGHRAGQNPGDVFAEVKAVAELR